MPQVPDVGGIAKHIRARIKQLEDQLKQRRVLSDELDRLRGALSRIEGAAGSRVGAGPRGRRPAAKSAGGAARANTARPASTAKRASTAKPAPARAGAPRGQNKAKVLDALKGGGPMTASEIAKATGIGADTVSALLTKMAKTGELAKAQRGYTLPQPRAGVSTAAAGQREDRPDRTP
jgi:DNA-binding transcriptional ArsR family regulator